MARVCRLIFHHISPNKVIYYTFILSQNVLSHSVTIVDVMLKIINRSSIMNRCPSLLNMHEGRTGVFLWRVINWFYFPWNVNLEKHSWWSVIWRFCETREERELPIFVISTLHSTWFYFSGASPLGRMVKVVLIYQEWHGYANYSFRSLELAFLQTLFLV